MQKPQLELSVEAVPTVVNGTFGELTLHFERERLNQYDSGIASLIGQGRRTQQALGMWFSEERKWEI